MWNVEAVESGSATMSVNGAEYEVDAGQDLKDVVLGFARDAGFQKFRFFIDGEEVLPQDAPTQTEAGKEYKITAYDQAG